MLGIGAGLFWFWRQATYLPDWYTQAPTNADTEPVLSGADVDQAEERQALKLKLARQVEPIPTASSISRPSAPSSSDEPPLPAVEAPPPSGTPTHEVTLDADTFNEFVVSAIPQTSQSEVIFPAIKAINTAIEQGQVKTGLVVNMAELPLEQLPEQTRSHLEQALKTFPFLKDQEVYLGIVGQPRLESGRVLLGEDAKVQVGGLTLDLADAAERIGLPVETLESKINLQLGQLQVQDINFTDTGAVLQGTVD